MVDSILGTVGHITLAWTAASVVLAAAWSVYRMPGRSQRLAYEALADATAVTADRAVPGIVDTSAQRLAA